MTDTNKLVTENIELWTSAIKKRNSQGRGSSKKTELVGINKLRELILELAVRGKLVQQEPTDEPARELLEKITVKKNELINQGKIKKQKNLFKLSDDEKPFELKLGWEFTRLENLTELITKGSSPKWQGVSYTDDKSDILFVTSENVGAFELLLDKKKFVEKKFNEIEPRSILKKNDLLMNIVGASIGRTATYDIDDLANINQAVCLIRTFPEYFTVAYSLIFFNSPVCISYMYDKQVDNARPNLSMSNISKFVIPVPPLAEQKRIVAKVDELMLLCDDLEQQTEESISAHQTLVEVLLATLINPTPTISDKADTFQQNWQRIAENFNVLFTTEHSIEQLKQTILQLAVMGKLVPQNPKDEPASVLLEKIAGEKEQLIADKKIKKQKALPEITDKEKPFELPSGWELCRLVDLLPQFQNGASSRGDSDGEDIVVLRLADIKNWEMSFADTRSIAINEKSVERYTLEKGDVLIIRVNGSADIVGRFITCHQNHDAIYCDHFIRMRFPIECFSSSYLSLLGSSSMIRDKISELFISTAGQKTVNQKHIGSLMVTLPPLAEQHRIVTKVDELMSLCEQLKNRLKDAQSTQLQLADTIVAQAVN